MIALEKSQQNLSDYNQFLLKKKKIQVDKKYILSSEKILKTFNPMRDTGTYVALIACYTNPLIPLLTPPPPPSAHLPAVARKLC